MEDLADLISRGEDRLICILHGYIVSTGYSRYSATLEGAWRLSVSMLSTLLVTSCRTRGERIELGPDVDFSQDPIAQFGIVEAQRHRERGIDLVMFLGLMKYYRQSFLDLVAEGGLEKGRYETCRRFVDRFFDLIELGICSEWSTNNETQLLRELRAGNRIMTNEKNRYLTVFESLPHPAIIVDEQFRVLHLNHATREMLGGVNIPGSPYYCSQRDRHLEEEEAGGAHEGSFRGESVGMLFPWLLSPLADFARSDDSHRVIEQRIRTQEGVLFFEVKMSRMLDISGKFGGFIAALTDITLRKRAEETLHESERRFRLLFESMTSGFALHEIMVNEEGTPVDYRFLEVNPAFEKLTGLPAEDLIGRNALEVMPDTAAKLLRRYADVAMTGESAQFQSYSIESHRHYEITAYSPKPGQFAVIFLDITGYKEAEAALVRAAEQRMLAVEAADFGAWDYLFDKGDVFWDKRCRMMWGVPHGGRIDYALAVGRIHHEDRDGTDQAMKDAIAGAWGGAFHREFRVVWPDGSVHWIASHGRVYFEGKGEARRPVRFIGVNEEITRQKLAEETLARVNQDLQRKVAALQTILDVAPIGLAIAEDTSGRNIRWNPALQRIFGMEGEPDLSRKAATPAPCEIYEDGRLLVPDELPMQRAILGHTVTGKVMDVIRKDGAVLQLHCNATPLLDELGRPCGAVGAFMDVSELRRAEKELLESRHRLSVIMDSIVDGFFALDRSLRFTHVNDAALRYMGLSHEKVIGRSISELFPRFQDSVFDIGYRQALSSGEPVHLEVMSVLTDRMVEVHAYPGPDNITILFRDVNERYQMADALRESEARFRTIFEQAGIGIGLVALDGRLRMANPAMCGMLGYSREELEQKTFKEVTHPADLAIEQKLLDGLIGREFPSYRSEKRLIHKDGHCVWVRVTSSLVDEGPASYRVSMIEDITDRKRVEDALRESEERLRMAQHAANAGTWEWDLDTGRNFWSDELWRLYGIQPHSFQPSYDRWLQLVHPEDRERAEQVVVAAAEGGNELNIEWRVGGTDKTRWLLSRGSPVRDVHGRTIRYIGIAVDITERKVVEDALQQSLEEKIALLKEVHHRVKNNLQIVASLLGLQTSRTTNPVVIDVLQDTRNRVLSMALLHEALYRLGNLGHIDFSDYIAELCGQLLRSFGSIAGRVKIEHHVAHLSFALEQAVPCGLIINELVSNALKHGFPGERTGKITIDIAMGNGRMCVLCIRDNGVGLPQGMDPAGTATLGLKLVSKLVGQLEGHLTMAEAEGGGAAFRVVFPVRLRNVARLRNECAEHSRSGR